MKMARESVTEMDFCFSPVIDAITKMPRYNRMPMKAITSKNETF
jgi:hypothetical protein